LIEIFVGRGPGFPYAGYSKGSAIVKRIAFILVAVLGNSTAVSSLDMTTPRTVARKTVGDRPSMLLLMVTKDGTALGGAALVP
jgi:hypothetical protein